MITYWLIFVLITSLAIMAQPRQVPRLDNTYPTNIDSGWVFIIFFLTIFIGLRYQVGGDWFIYEEHLIESIGASMLSTISKFGDPGYYFFNWISGNLGLNVYGVNLVCALIFSIGLFFFCRSQPRPLLALAVAIPYLIIVVGMGYTRQAAAIGLAMVGISMFIKGRLGLFMFWIFLAAAFHKSAVFLIPMGIASIGKSSFLRIFSIFLIALISFYLYLDQYIEKLYENYITAQSQSSGAFIRLSMNAVPALIYLIFRQRFNLSKNEKSLYFWFSFISIILLILFFILNSSTALDRIALYMIPLQLAVFSRLPDILGGSLQGRSITFLFVIVFYSLVMFVWLNFASHSYLWVPYKFFPAEYISS